MSDERGDAAGYLGWFFLGALAGAATALLLAPKSGRETRGLLLEKGGELAEKAQEAMGVAQERASVYFEKGKEYLEDQTRRLTSAVEAGREAMKEEIAKSRREK
ncbi:MAG TPA: YtxH domain-containing protein [Methylomirabilota bacterium]|nr:YtxH domain-containing protein [Methylomirabilota bacterium]